MKADQCGGVTALKWDMYWQNGQCSVVRYESWYHIRLHEEQIS